MQSRYMPAMSDVVIIVKVCHFPYPNQYELTGIRTKAASFSRVHLWSKPLLVK